MSSDTETAFLIGGKVVKVGTEFEFYVTGDINVTTDASAVRQDVTTIDLTGTFVSDTQIALELLATANVETFSRMGVVFTKGEKDTALLEAAINNVTADTDVYQKVAVHNSSVDTANVSGLYQFTYAPYMAKASAKGELFFYTFAVDKDGNITLSAPTSVNLNNITA